MISNFPNRFISWTLRRLVFPLGRPYVVPSDELGHAVAKLLIEPSATRDRLTAGMFVSSSEDNPVGAIELALAATLAADPIEAKIKDAVKAGRLSVKPREDRIAAAQSAGIITAEESSALRRAQPVTLLVRFAPRQRQKPMNELLSASQERAELDPIGSLIDGDMGAYYNWLNLQRLTGAVEASFLVWFEEHSKAVAISPSTPRGTESTASTTMGELLSWVS